MTLRRLPGGRANCGDDDEDGNRMVELVRLIKEGYNCTLAHLHMALWAHKVCSEHAALQGHHSINKT